MSTPAKPRNQALRGPLFHLAIVGVSVAAAAVLWTRDEEPKIAATNDVTVWAGRQGDVEHIVYESRTKKVVLDAKKDAQGSYLVGVLDMETPAIIADPAAASAKAVAPPAPTTSAAAGAPAPSSSAKAGPAPSGSARAGAPAPSGSAKAGAPAPSGSARAGAPAPSGSAKAGPAPSAVAAAPPSASAAASPPAPAKAGPPGRTIITFVSITAGNKLSDALAPFKALRALGKIEADRLADFGLAQPDATVSIKLVGGEKRLLLGAITPGGGDRYVKESSTGEVFVVRGEPFRFLDAPDSWMIERDLHAWKEAEVVSAVLSAGGKTRKLLNSGPEGKKFWADAATPNDNDDALNNWMSKLYRLKAMEFVTEAPPNKEVVLRVEFMGQKPLGFIELVKTPTGPDGSPEYLIQTERTRLYAKAPNLFTEQIEQDLGVALK